MTSTLTDNPKENRILATLSVEEYQRLLPWLELVCLKLGQVLYGSGDRQSHVYFPTTAIVSLVFTTENGSSAELAIIGNDGLVGTPVILSGISTTHQATVQSAGNAYRLRSELVRHEFDLGGGLQSLALRYTQAQMAQMTQSVVCNRHHSVDKQLCRWLLLSLDRLPTNQIRMTHELIANMLGVRREGVSSAAGKLQTAGLIRYCRGLITVLDRPGLEARVCECYSVIKKELDRLFSLPMETPHAENPLPQPDTLPHHAETRDRYADIYDFAPIGYFTLDTDARILDLNLAGAILLGIKRSEKALHRFNAFVSPAYLPEFKRFLAEVLTSQSKKECEVELLLNARRGATKLRIEAVPDEEGSECRMVAIDISAEKQAEKQLTLHDEATRLPNRPLLYDRLMRSMESNKRNGTLGALIYLGLDTGSLPNLPLGQDEIDGLMSQIAIRLQSSVRAADTVARISEQEFVVVIEKLLANRAESTFEAGCIAKKICESFAKPFQLERADQSVNPVEHACSISAGVILFANPETPPESILSSAALAMQRARNAGKNLVRFHEADAKTLENFQAWQGDKRSLPCHA